MSRYVSIVLMLLVSILMCRFGLPLSEDSEQPTASRLAFRVVIFPLRSRNKQPSHFSCSFPPVSLWRGLNLSNLMQQWLAIMVSETSTLLWEMFVLVSVNVLVKRS
ncbi:hypothetical protein BGZ60DRAFT_400656 [Tricladium varicosporioides]|nr:hypothetical protein BGZ60DRAFT_400656 [Hymenoscyphus varicosporioides]